MPEDKKSWSGWSRDVAMFAAGAAFGATATVGVGYATESIRTPAEREAAVKAKETFAGSKADTKAT